MYLYISFQRVAMNKITAMIIVLFSFSLYASEETGNDINNYKKADIEQNIKSIYIGKETNFTKIMHLLKTCNANAVVIDVKDDWGNIHLPMQSVDQEDDSSSTHKLKSLIKKLEKQNVYPIARVVAFKDFVRKDLCIKDSDGNVITDKEKTSWMSPYNCKVRNYLKNICCRAIKIGFKEVQLDYVRFSSTLTLHDSKDKAQRITAINQFLDEICDSVHELGGKVSVCVFGCIIEKTKKQFSTNSKVLGQDYVSICKRADFVCPMIYPSHYAKGFGGIKNPDLAPYKVIYSCMKLSNEILKNLDVKSVVRPYLQAFTATWLKKHKRYRKKEINEQIQALKDTECFQWGLFNMGLKYPEN